MNSGIITFLMLLFFLTNLRASDIKGSVNDDHGNPIVGASVFLESVSKGAISRSNGEYHIKNVKPGSYFIICSILGYNTEKVEIVVTQSDLSLNFSLGEIPIKLGEVVVIANKREENLQSIPVSVSAISRETIEDLQIQTRSDLMAISPNTLVAETGSHMSNLVNIRGMFPAKPLEVSSTLFYYDGIPIYTNDLSPSYLNDIDRIEILRGPQGTLYGRNALSGVINLVSRKPNNKASYNVGGEFGNHSKMNIHAGISVPIIEDQLFFRVSGYYYKHDGYFTNTLLDSANGGKNSGWNKGAGGSLNIRFFPSETFSAEVFASVESIDENIWTFAANPTVAMDKPYEFQRDFDSYVKKLNSIGSLKLNLQTDLFNIISTTAFQSISGLDWQYDADFSAVDYVNYFEKTPFQFFSEEIRFESKDQSSDLRWVTGLFVGSDKYDVNYGPIYGKIAKEDLAKALGVPEIFIPTIQDSITDLTKATEGTLQSTNYALFGQINYKIMSNLDATLGIRYDIHEKEVNYTTFWKYSGFPTSLPPQLSIPIRGYLSPRDTTVGEKSYNFLSPKFALSYIFDEHNMAYASLTWGYHEGGFNSGANKRIPSYDPESTVNYELGYKTTLFEDKLRVNTSLFMIKWTNQQLMVIGNLANPLTTIGNVGESTNQGFELEFSTIPVTGLIINGSIGLLSTNLDSYTFHDSIPVTLITNKDTVYNFTGNEMPFAPKFSSLLSFKYEYPLHIAGIIGNLMAELDYQHIDPYYMSQRNIFKSNARNLLNCKIGFNTSNFDLHFWMKNMLDYRYIYAVYEFRGETETLLGAPRTLGVSANLRY